MGIPSADSAEYDPGMILGKVISVISAYTSSGPSGSEIAEAESEMRELYEKRHLNRTTVFEALQMLGIEPFAMRNGRLGNALRRISSDGDCEGDLLPLRTIGDAWKIVLENSKAISTEGFLKAHRFPKSYRGDIRQTLTIMAFSAALYYDPSMGSFFTYFRYWSLQADRALEDEREMIRFPANVRENIGRMKKFCYGKERDDGEIAEYLGVSPGEVARLRGCRTIRKNSNTPLNIFSLENEPPQDGRISAREKTAALAGSMPADRRDALDLEDMRKCAREALATLKNPRERDIVGRRLGLVTGKGETLEEIGKGYAFSRERARQLEARGLRNIRRALSRMETDAKIRIARG